MRRSAILAAALIVAACSSTPAGSPQAPGGAIVAHVGAVLSLTEDAAVYGATQKNGLELARDEINAAGKVRIELVIEDDASDPATGITAFQKLINHQDRIAAIIGPTLSNTAASADPKAQEAGVPVLGVSNTAAGITDIGDFIFRNSLTEGQVIPNTIAKAKSTYSLTKVAVMYGQDDAFTKSGYDVFAQALADTGINVLTTETFAKGDKDFSAQLTTIVTMEPDAIVVSALAPEGSLILQQARTAGFAGPIIGGNGFNSPTVITNAGAAAEGLVVGAAWNSASENPENKAFLAAYQGKFNAAPDQFAAQAYSGLKIIAAAIEAAGSADRVAIKSALATKVNGILVPLGSFSFTPTRDADHLAVVQIVKDGEFQIVSEAAARE